MNVGKSTVSKWVTQLQIERHGLAPEASPMTPEQIEIKALKREIKRINLEKEILKIPKGHTEATALLMSDSLNNSRYSRNSIRATNTLFQCYATYST